MEKSRACKCSLSFFFLCKPETQRLGAAGSKAQGIIAIKREQTTKEVRRERKKKNSSNVGAKKGSNNDKPNENGVSVLDWNLSGSSSALRHFGKTGNNLHTWQVMKNYAARNSFTHYSAIDPTSFQTGERATQMNAPVCFTQILHKCMYRCEDTNPPPPMSTRPNITHISFPFG